MDIQALVSKLHPLERKVAPHLRDGITVSELSEKTGLQEVEATRAVQWLFNKQVLTLTEEVTQFVSLDKNGVIYQKTGLPETRFVNVLKGEMTLSEIAKQAELDKQEVNSCLGNLKKRGIIDIVKGKELKVKVIKEFKSLEESFIQSLTKEKDTSTLKPEERHALDQLNKRKGIVKLYTKKDKIVRLTELGKKLSKTKIDTNVLDNVTHEMLKTGSWKNRTFRGFDVTINVPQKHGGKRHFVNQAIRYVKQVWLDLGFEEMTGSMVHTSFWDLDTLFVPQDHPARAMQDTYYLKSPNKGSLPSWYKKIKAVHETGSDTKSTGWGSKWSEDVAQELLLRTHTTVLSAQTIQKLKQNDLPKKFFSVGKVFRNEALDWKHLFEFYQVEGIVVDEDANFRNLLGYLKEFFGKMGYKDVRIRPAHFPYTEPSAEIEVLHPIKNTWVELGGCGIFRPEVTKPLIGSEVPVLAWGFGLERIITPYYGITDLRDIYKNDLKQLREMKLWLK